MNPVIVVDTREQKAYSFDVARASTVRAALPAGDYSLAGKEDRVAVERKSLDDLVNTVIRERERFHNELKRLATYDAACVVVEGDLAHIFARSYTSRAHPNSVVGAVMSIIVDYGIPVYFCSTRPLARLFTQEFLIRYDSQEPRP